MRDLKGKVSDANEMNSMYDEKANNFDYLFQKSDLVAGSQSKMIENNT